MPKAKQVQEQSEVPELNEDGLAPGQEVSFYELLRIMSEQRNKDSE